MQQVFLYLAARDQVPYLTLTTNRKEGAVAAPLLGATQVPPAVTYPPTLKSVRYIWSNLAPRLGLAPAGH